MSPRSTSSVDFIFEAHQVVKSYSLGKNSVPVLNNFSASFPTGKTTTVCGPSGCGKSTLLQLLGGLDQPNAGEIHFKNTNISSWSRSDLASWRNQHIGFIFQSYHLIHELTALENILLPALLRKQDKSEKAHELMEQMGLSHRKNHLPSELSGGEQQRVAIARSLINSPEVILADEPTGNLDSKTAHSIVDLLLELQKKNNLTLILVTHDQSIAAQGDFKITM